MAVEFRMNRRSVLRAVVGTTVVLSARPLMADDLPPVTTYRNPGCACCEKWRQLMADAGFKITMHEDANLAARATSLGVPEKLHGCHTGTVGDYIISGHIPPTDVIRLLREKPKISGLTVPGMPIGSPGMAAERQKDSFNVLAFKSDGSSYTFARY
jgi:hypothetical protein